MLRPNVTRRYVLALGAACLGGAATAALVGRGALDVTVLAALVGLVAAVGCVATAVARFDLFICGLLAIRPALDGLNQGTQESSSGMLSPSVAVGVAFVGASAVWLSTRAWTRRLVAPSLASSAWAGLVGAGALSCLVSAYRMTSIAATLRLAAAALMFIVLEQALAARLLTVRSVLASLTAAGCLVTGWTLIQAATGGGALDPWTGLTRVTGPFVHPSVLAKFLVICALVLFAALLWPRFELVRPQVALPTLVIVLVCLGLTYTRIAWFAAIIGFAYLLWRKNWRFLPAFAIAGIVMVVSIPAVYARVSDLWNSPPPAPGAPDNSMAWRISYWEHLLPMARMSPINGRGLDTIPLIGGQNLAAHNIWVQSVVEMGVMGLLALLSVVIAGYLLLRKALRSRRDVHPLTAAAVAVAISILSMSFSENILNETTTLWYVACVLACGVQVARHAPRHSVPDASDRIPS